MYKPANHDNWKGRITKGAKHFFQIVDTLDMTNDIWTPSKEINFAILSFASDEGVRRNKGRVGARNGPFQIQRELAKLAVHFDEKKVGISDAGTVFCATGNLEAVGLLFSEKILSVLENDYFPIVLGGGHETAYPHFSALKSFFKGKQKLGIVNIDAHLDMRTYENGQHSGSPFRQILDDSLVEGFDFLYFPIGIREESNNSSMISLMKESGQEYLRLETIYENEKLIEEKLGIFLDKLDKVYLTIDMDCFPAAYAPGVSASAPDGLLPFHVKKIISILAKSGKLASMDIVEVNPGYDRDNITSKLAANLIYYTIENLTTGY